MAKTAPLLVSLLITELLVTSCNIVNIPTTPPTDRLYYPAGITTNATTLAVVSTNENQKYLSGSVALIDKAYIYGALEQSSGTTPITITPSTNAMQMLYVPTQSTAPTFLSSGDNLLLLSRLENQLQMLNRQNGKWTCANANGIDCSGPSANVFIPGSNPNYTVVDELTQTTYVAYQNSYGAAPKISGESGVEVQYQGLFQAFPYTLPLSTPAIKMGPRFALAAAIEADDVKQRRRQYEEAKLNTGASLDGTEGSYAGLENPNSSSRTVVVLSGMQLITLQGVRYIAIGVNTYRPTDDASQLSSRARLALVPLSLLQSYIQEAKTTQNIPLSPKDVILIDVTAPTQYVEIINFVQSENESEMIFLLTRRGKGAGIARLKISDPANTENRLAALVPTCANPKDMQVATVQGGDRRIFVTCFGNDTVMSYQETDLGVIGMQRFDGRGPTYMAVDKDTAGIARAVFVTFNIDGSVGIYDPFTLAFRGRIFQQSAPNQLGGTP